MRVRVFRDAVRGPDAVETGMGREVEADEDEDVESDGPAKDEDEEGKCLMGPPLVDEEGLASEEEEEEFARLGLVGSERSSGVVEEEGIRFDGID